MSKRKVAIIGAGVVGASAAYILSKEKDIELTIFDEGIGQGTSASAGIISPWLSKRRNKEWYRMVKAGAAYYPNFLSEVMSGEPIPEAVYKKVGTLLFKKKKEQLDELLDIAKKRREDAPEIGNLALLSPEEIREKIPVYSKEKPALWASGGARVHGEKIVELLLTKAQNNGATFKKTTASLQKESDSSYTIHTEKEKDTFDSVILAVSAWLPELLAPLDYSVDIRPQKGQLVEIKLDQYNTSNWPVVMPEGQKNIIPFEDGHIIIGATHEDDSRFDLTIEEDVMYSMIKETTETFSSDFRTAIVAEYRAGIRAHTSDFSPFFGQVPGSKNLFAASGLGSTGLTAGPLVGKCLAELVLGQESSLPLEDYPIENYISSFN